MEKIPNPFAILQEEIKNSSEISQVSEEEQWKARQMLAREWGLDGAFSEK